MNRGGDRKANSALHHIVLVRMRYDQRTKDYAARRTAEGLDKREIMRCLKRDIAPQVFALLVQTLSLNERQVKVLISGRSSLPCCFWLFCYTSAADSASLGC
ncbi:hypothetical protein DBZ45_16600 [Arthrobacter globiformis]|uniref:IS110 family transposase n=1 Tax=Arthrobacter globiformis TaxID=1665 RepID=A0A328HB82_ARTGO|nr:hypothetical protein DBZ45_16600 [Arthrobacter globiformis]